MLNNAADWIKGHACLAMLLLIIKLLETLFGNTPKACIYLLESNLYFKSSHVNQKKAFPDIFRNKCSWKFRNIHRKAPSRFLIKFLKRNSSKGVFLLILRKFLTKIFLHSHIFSLPYFRLSHQRCSLRKGVLRNFAKLTGKHLRQSLF